MSYTCPFSRCRLPLATYDELVAHVDDRTQAENDYRHNVDVFTPEDLVAEVRHLVAANLRLEGSCGHYRAVADSYIEAVRRSCPAVRAGGPCGV